MSEPFEIVLSSTRSDCRRYGLVLQAVGIEHAIRFHENNWVIIVRTQDADRARKEIEEYGIETAPQSIAPSQFPGQIHNGWPGVAGYAIVLLLFAWLQHGNLLAWDLTDAGKMRSDIVRTGELWRSVTALTLHANTSHLVGNILIGGLVGVFAGQMLGSGLAWFTILIAGAFGNLFTALIRPDGHTSLGASTAVFAALGLMAGYAWSMRQRVRTSPLMRYAPLIGAAILLGYLGTGGERTDVLAHVAGFMSGILFGVLYATPGRTIHLRRPAQWALGIGTILLLAVAWLGAVARINA